MYLSLKDDQKFYSILLGVICYLGYSTTLNVMDEKNTV